MMYTFTVVCSPEPLVCSPACPLCAWFREGEDEVMS